MITSPTYDEDDDGFVKPAHRVDASLRASQLEPPVAGASVKDIAKNMQLPIMGMGNRNMMLLEKKRKEEEERRRRAQEEEEEYERKREEDNKRKLEEAQ